ncbi:MAG: amidohydrolase [Ilumatobacter sp.]
MIPPTADWLAQVTEAPIDPDREIVDPHHHLWPQGGALPYGIDDLVGDTSGGHRIVETVFIECHAAYLTEGPEHLRSLGETEFVAQSALELEQRHPTAAPISGIVVSVDLTRDDLDDVLDAHEAAAQGRLRGVRDALARSREPDAHAIPSFAAEGKFEDPAFVRGVQRLGERGLTYDSWHFHYQNTEFTQLAQAAPGTTMVLDHFGTPAAIGSDAGRHDEIFETWRLDMTAIASCANTVAKLGGLAMPDNGFGYHQAEVPPTSDEFLTLQRRWYEHAIESFGPERSMFESNFPVDRFSLSYGVYWNAMKKLAAPYTEAEQAAMFAGTARRTYGLG